MKSIFKFTPKAIFSLCHNLIDCEFYNFKYTHDEFAGYIGFAGGRKGSGSNDLCYLLLLEIKKRVCKVSIYLYNTLPCIGLLG